MATEKKNAKRAVSTGNSGNTGKQKKTTDNVTTKDSSARRTSSKSSGTKAATALDRKQIQNNDDRTIKIIVGLIFIVLGVFLFVAVQFQAAGQLGNIIGQFLKGTMGLIGVIFPFYLILAGIMMIADKTVRFSTISFVLGFVILLMLCVLNSGRFIDSAKIVFNAKDFFDKGVELKSGGLFGMGIGSFLVKYLGKIGLYCISIGVTILSLFLLLKDTPAKRLVNYIRLKSQERQIQKAEIKAIKDKEKEEREKEQLQIIENKKRINEIKEDQKRKRAETKEKNAKEREEAKNSSADSDIEGWPGLIPKGYNALDDFDSTKFDKGIPNEKTERIISVMNDESNSSMGAVPSLTRKTGTKGIGLEEQRVARPGFGLGEYDSRSDGLIIEMPKKPKTDSVTAKDNNRINLKEERTSAEAKASSSGQEGMSSKFLGRDSAEYSGSSDSTLSAATGNAKNVDRVHQETAANPVNQEDKPNPEYNVTRLSKKEAREATLADSDFNKTEKNYKYKKPTIDLLEQVNSSTDADKASYELKEKADLLERTLRSFNVDAKVIKVTQGPAVTRYEIQPNVGVKVNKIVNLADDIALNMRAKSIRIEAPIPGRAAVGIEVENDNVSMVSIRELIDSKEFKQSKSKISFVVGRDISGNAIVADLKSMPHLLIAGSTGSGKSVCINSIITSILYKANPDEVKLVLIDPKVVELGDYNGIPHLLIPVVTEPAKAAAALNWAVAEMEKRYRLFAEKHVRKLADYNELLKSNGETEIMPEIVIIIDELADLMMAAPSQVEVSISRLAQLARAAGMHLIVATQRPSVSVITGDIKANIPSRIAFAVASQFDSRTILDMGGAEHLVGKGDMLYNPLDMIKPIRVQGCFISPEEISRVIDFVKNQQDVDYNNEVLDTINKGNSQNGAESASDELFDEAVEFVISAGKASTSLIQRRFRIGYNRAANIVDEMEAKGIIGPAEGSKPRQVLATSVPSGSGYGDAYDNDYSSSDGTVEDLAEDQEEVFVVDETIDGINDTDDTYDSFREDSTNDEVTHEEIIHNEITHEEIINDDSSHDSFRNDPND